MISDAEIAKSVETILRQTDPNAMTSLNAVVQQLEAKHGLDLSHKAGFIRDHINNLIMSSHQQQLQQQQQQQTHKDHFALHSHPQFQQQAQHFPSHFAIHPHHPPPPQLHHHLRPQQQPIPHELNFRHPQPQPQPPPAVQTPAAQIPPKESAPTGVKRRGGPGGLNKVCGVSPELQVIVGEPALPRTEIVKKLWAYIRKYNLQDPSNKRKIICDDALRVVFETDCTDMFKMNKLLAKHIIPINSAKDADKAKRLKVDDESPTETADPSQTLVKISEALAKFLGFDGKEMLQSEAEKRVWEYIKVNKLEDPLNSMAILCDAKLRELLGCESISALGIGEMLKRHHFLERS